MCLERERERVCVLEREMLQLSKVNKFECQSVGIIDKRTSSTGRTQSKFLQGNLTIFNIYILGT